MGSGAAECPLPTEERSKMPPDEERFISEEDRRRLGQMALLALGMESEQSCLVALEAIREIGLSPEDGVSWLGETEGEDGDLPLAHKAAAGGDARGIGRLAAAGWPLGEAFSGMAGADPMWAALAYGHAEAAKALLDAGHQVRGRGESQEGIAALAAKGLLGLDRPAALTLACELIAESPRKALGVVAEGLRRGAPRDEVSEALGMCARLLPQVRGTEASKGMGLAIGLLLEAGGSLGAIWLDFPWEEDLAGLSDTGLFMHPLSYAGARLGRDGCFPQAQRLFADATASTWCPPGALDPWRAFFAALGTGSLGDPWGPIGIARCGQEAESLMEAAFAMGATLLDNIPDPSEKDWDRGSPIDLLKQAGVDPTPASILGAAWGQSPEMFGELARSAWRIFGGEGSLSEEDIAKSREAFVEGAIIAAAPKFGEERDNGGDMPRAEAFIARMSGACAWLGERGPGRRGGGAEAVSVATRMATRPGADMRSKALSLSLAESIRNALDENERRTADEEIAQALWDLSGDEALNWKSSSSRKACEKIAEIARAFVSREETAGEAKEIAAQGCVRLAKQAALAGHPDLEARLESVAIEAGASRGGDGREKAKEPPSRLL